MSGAAPTQAPRRTDSRADGGPVLLAAGTAGPATTAARRWAEVEAGRLGVALRVLGLGEARAAAVGAALLVVPGPGPDADTLVRETPCPVVVVPATEPRPGAPVLLAAGPATGPEVVTFAFAAAARRDCAVRALRAWHEPTAELASHLGRGLHRWDVARSGSERALHDQLAAAAAAHPDVPLEAFAVDDERLPLLHDAAHGAGLLVLGRSSRPDDGGADPSPARRLSSLLACPVAVVPTRIDGDRSSPTFGAIGSVRAGPLP